MVKLLPEFEYFKCILENRFISKIRRSKVTNYAALNTAKTKGMVITTSQKRLHLHNNVFNQTYNSDILKNVNNDKVLGVFIDKNLTWPIHMQSIAKKISSNLWLLSKLKEFFSRENKVHFYKTYIQPHTDYCSTVW